MENIISFLKGEKSKNDELLKINKERLSSVTYQIKEIDNMVNELSKNIDTTFEIFSPNAFNKDNNVVEIEKLNYKKGKSKEEIESIKEYIVELEEKKQKIDLALEEIKDIENEMASNVKNTKNLINKEVNKTKDKYSNDLVNILEYQINKDSHFITDTLNKKLKIIENKFALCENFMDMDFNRAKLEMVKLKEDISKLIKSNQSEMFHVKHFQNERLINESISEFIHNYKKNINMKIEYSFIGEDIYESSENVTNVIRIIKEAIDNSVKHSFGTVCNIDVAIDKLNEDEESNENTSAVADMKQINFTLRPEGEYNITVKVTDNGNGFVLQDDKVLVANGLYGISIMKFRAGLFDGSFNIESINGLGTSINLTYVIKR